MSGITWDQISGLLQRILMFAGGLAVGKGWISEELMTQIVGAIIGIGGILWGVKVNTKTALVQSVNAMPEVQAVITKPTPEGVGLASAVPAGSVVPAGTTMASDLAK